MCSNQTIIFLQWFKTIVQKNQLWRSDSVSILGQTEPWYKPSVHFVNWEMFVTFYQQRVKHIFFSRTPPIICLSFSLNKVWQLRVKTHFNAFVAVDMFSVHFPLQTCFLFYTLSHGCSHELKLSWVNTLIILYSGVGRSDLRVLVWPQQSCEITVGEQIPSQCLLEHSVVTPLVGAEEKHSCFGFTSWLCVADAVSGTGNVESAEYGRIRSSGCCQSPAAHTHRPPVRLMQDRL